MKEKKFSSGQYYGLLEEYRSLRKEKLKRQNARLQILGFTMAAIATIIIGFTLKENGLIRTQFDFSVLIIFALMIINSALIFTIQHTQQIIIISNYIKKFIESKITEIKWETRWAEYREFLKKQNPKISSLILGTSKSLALFYAFLTMAVYSLVFISHLYNFPLIFILVSILAIFSFFLCYDLYSQKTKSWKIINWDIKPPK